ncbi:MAG: glutathione S-transferase family protein [Pseudorhodobacter sp.]
MLTLYSVPHSLYCAKTRILLRAKGLVWEERAPEGGAASPRYRARFPFGNLPGLLDGDFALEDSEAIAEYIEETRPTPPMLPQGAEARARMRERGRFHDTRLEPALRRLFPQVATPDAATLPPLRDDLNLRLAQLGRLVNDHPLPFGLGDCGYAPTFLWIDLLDRELGWGIHWPAPVQAYRATLEALPAVAAELADYRPHAQGWIAGKRGR